MRMSMKITSKISKGLLIHCLFWLGCGVKTDEKLQVVNKVQTIQKSKHYDNPIKGFWIVYKFESGHVTAITDDDAKTWIGKRMDLTDSTFSFNNDNLSNVRFESEKVEADHYFYMGYRVNPKRLGIKDKQVQIIKIVSNNDNSGRSIEDLIFVHEELIASRDGYFFFLKKQN